MATKIASQDDDLRQQRPVADLAEVQAAEIVEVHVFCLRRRRSFRRRGRRAAGRRLGRRARPAASSGDARLIRKFSVNSLIFWSRSCAPGIGTSLISTAPGCVEPRRRLDVAHQRRDARIRLRVADDRHLGAGLLDRSQVDAVGQLAHELVEQVHRFAAVRLQRLDDLLARQHRLDLVAQPVDLLDLLVELGDLGLQQRCCATAGSRSAPRGCRGPARRPRGPAPRARSPARRTAAGGPAASARGGAAG